MRIFATVPQQDLRKVGPAARAIEAEGHDGIVTMENQHEPFLALAVAGAATETIELHTSVAIAFARTPMAVAEVGWDLAGSTGGRFVVGLGSQVRAHNERRFSVPWTPPAPRMREYVQVLRAIWHCWATGEKPAFEGQHYRFTLMTPNFTPADRPPAAGDDRRGRPGDAQGRRRGMRRGQAARVLHPQIPDRRDHAAHRGGARQGRPHPRAIRDFRRRVSRHRAGRRGVAERFEWVRQRVAFYGSTPAYYPVLAVHRLEDLGHKLNALVRQGKWTEMAKEVPDDVAHLFAAVGRHDQIVGAIGRRFGGLADALTLRADGVGGCRPTSSRTSAASRMPFGLPGGIEPPRPARRLAHRGWSSGTAAASFALALRATRTAAATVAISPTPNSAHSNGPPESPPCFAALPSAPR